MADALAANEVSCRHHALTRPAHAEGAATRKAIEMARRADAPLYIVHRIDRATSGLLAFALTRPAERGLARQFREHTAERTYLCLAHGKVRTGTIESDLVVDRGDGIRGSSRFPGYGKHAVTHVRALEHDVLVDLVRHRDEVVAHAQLGEHLQLGAREHAARGVRRRVEHQEPGLVRNRGLDRRPLEVLRDEDDFRAPVVVGPALQPGNVRQKMLRALNHRRAIWLLAHMHQSLHPSHNPGAHAPGPALARRASAVR